MPGSPIYADFFNYYFLKYIFIFFILRSPIWRHLWLKWLFAATLLNSTPSALHSSCCMPRQRTAGETAHRTTHNTTHCLRNIEQHTTQRTAWETAHRHIGIRSHLSGLPAPATRHLNLTLGWNKPASAVATYNGYNQGCIFLQQLQIGLNQGCIILQSL